MWNHSKSLLLTAVWIRVALLAWIIIAVALPFWQQSRAVLVLFYFILLPMLLALYGLDRLLQRLRRGQVFSAENLALLRLVSWMCFFAAVFLLVAACLWPVLILGAGGVGFLGLFVRVVKNLLAEAIVLKDENDLTI